MAKVLDALQERYFDWMCGVVCDRSHSKRSTYQKLLSYLNSREFTYILDMDGNRAEDGIDLRYRFAYEKGYEYPIIARYLDTQPCSILEMMVALAIRCEEHIMCDDDIGNRTGQWFWNMVDTLGLGRMSDSRFDVHYADEIIDRFLNREYKRNGEGGLFKIDNCEHNLRNIEIWYQANWYLGRIN